MGLGSGLNTSASVTINVGVKKNASFRQFDAALAELKNNLKAVSTSLGGNKPLAQAVAGAAKTAKAVSAAQVKQQAITSRRMLDAHVKEFRGIERQQSASLRRQAAMTRNSLDAHVRDFRASEREKAATARQQAALTRKNLDAHVRDFRASEKEKTAILRQQEREQRASTARMAKEAKLRAAQRAMGINTGSASGMRDALLRTMDSAVRTGSGSYRGNNGNVQFSGIDKNRLAQNISGLRSYVSQLERGSTTTKEMVQATKLLNAAFQKEHVHAQRMKSDTAYRLDQTEKSLDAIFRAGFRLQMVGMDLQQIFHRIKNVLGGIMDTFGEFQFTMNRAAATMDMFAPGAKQLSIGISDLQESIISLSAESKIFPAAEVAEALYHWAAATGETIRTQQDLTENIDALEPIMKAAAMTATDYETTIKGVYGILSQFYSGDITQATHVTENLFYMTQKTAAEFQDLINAFKMVGPIAAQNNTTFEETAQIFGVLADLGIKGTMAGRALRQMFIQASRPSGPAMEALKLIFGGGEKEYYSKMNPGGRFIGAQGYVMELAKRLQKLNPAAMMKIVRSITTANELPMLMALVIRGQDRLSQGYDTLIGQSEKYMVTLDKEKEYFESNWTAMTDTWNAIAGSVQRTWEHLQIQLGSAMSEVLEPLLKSIQGIIESVRVWVKANPDLVKQLTRFAAGLAAVAAVAGAVFTAIGTVIGMLSGLALVVKVAWPMLGTIGAALTVIAAVSVGVARNIDYVSDSFDYLMDSISGSNASMEDMSGTMKSMMDGLITVIDKITRAVADMFVSLGDGIKRLDELKILKPILQFIVGYISAIVAIKIIRGFISLAVAVAKFAKSMIFVQAAAGPIGWITALAGLIGMLAIDQLPFGDMMGELVDDMRDLNSEINDLSKNIDGLNAQGNSTAMKSIVGKGLFGKGSFVTSIMSSNEILKGVLGGRTEEQYLKEYNDALRVQVALENSARDTLRANEMSNPLYDADDPRYTHLPDPTPLTQILLAPEYTDALQKARVQMTEDTLNAIIGARDDLNSKLALAGVETYSNEEFAAFFKALIPNFDNVSVSQYSDGLWGDMVTMVIDMVNQGGLGPQNRKVIEDAVNAKFGNGMGDVFTGGLSKALEALARDPNVAPKAVINQMSQSAAKIYGSVLANANAVLSSADLDEGGAITADVQGKILDILMSPPKAGMQSLYAYFSAGNPLPDYLRAGMQSLTGVLQNVAEEEGAVAAEDVWKAFSEAISDPAAMRKGIIQASVKGTDTSQVRKFVRKLFNLDGNGSKAFFGAFTIRNNTGLNQAINGMVSDLTTAVTNLLILRPGTDTKGLMNFIKGQVPTVHELEEQGFSHARAVKIRDALKKKMQPLYDFLKNPLGEEAVTSAPGSGIVDDKGKKWGDSSQFSIPKPNTSEFNTTVAETRETANKLQAHVTSVFKGVRSSIVRSAKGGTAGFRHELDNMAAFAYSKGFNVGKSWTSGFVQGVKGGKDSDGDGLSDVLEHARDLFFGGSPPKKGPLKDIDKGGYNIGTAWGESYSKGARESLNKGLMETKRNMYNTDNVIYKASSERKLRVEVDIKSSDGTATRKTQEDIRRGAMEALSLSEVSHLVSIT